MDLFQIPDDYKPEKPLTDQQMQDITKYLKNHPLFMKSIPQNIQQNQHLVALQALKQDEDLNTIAEGYNAQANQFVKKGPDNKMFLRHAYQKYTDAINVKCLDPKINAKIHSNRAQINLKLKNYGKVIIDCKISLKFDPQYVKSYYRYAKALIAVKKYEQVQKLLKDRNQPDLVQLKNIAQSELQKQKQEQQKKSKMANQKDKQIIQYCKKKSYKLIQKSQSLPQGVKIQFNGTFLSIPIIFAYPQFRQVDVIAKTQQNAPIKEYFKQLFQSYLPWDTKKQYSQNNCEMYYQISENIIMKIPKQAKISQIASRVSFKGAIELSVLCKNSSFYNIYLENKKII